MADDDRFDLDGRESRGSGAGSGFGGFGLGAADPDRHPPGREWTEAEQAELLQGYLEIPPALWGQIQAGASVRYYDKVGGFRFGGRVAQNPADLTLKGAAAPTRFFRLQGGFDARTRQPVRWLAAYGKVDRIFARPDVGALLALQTLEGAVRGLNENIRKLADHAKKLEDRVRHLEGK